MTYGYVRVSSRDQNEERQMIAMQDFGVEKRQGTVLCLEQEDMQQQGA